VNPNEFVGQKWHVEISSWRGTSVGAMHYYAKLGGPEYGDFYEVEYEVTPADTDLFLKWDSSFVEKPGWFSRRFWHEHEAIDATTVAWATVKGDGDILLLGRGAVADPQKILSGPADLVREANALFDDFELNGRWDGGRDGVVAQLCDLWDELLAPYQRRRRGIETYVPGHKERPKLYVRKTGGGYEAVTQEDMEATEDAAIAAEVDGVDMTLVTPPGFDPFGG